ncbi:NAD-dependent epimerase/dehydratase family protein [Litorivivens sp.]|uniref:NAD-dependent epimerase/dehydratase family protein n=2 Tax=Litorivivens sp. TaxID=2020868 RepID=UPI00356AE457
MPEALKTVLLSGAFGQVGKRCLDILLARNYRVIAVELRNSKTESIAAARQSAHDNLVVAFADLLDRGAVDTLFRHYCPDAVIHLAAICSPPCYLNPSLARRVNVDATRHLLEAAVQSGKQPLFAYASSSAVFGSRNPFLHPHGVDDSTPVKPIECYGRDKVDSENLVIQSGLPYAVLRLAGVLSPDGLGNMKGEYLLLTRATPGDTRVHGVDARDAALAFANAIELPAEKRDRVFLIGGNDSYLKTQREIEDDMMAAIGIGRLGEGASLPGDPDDEYGWSFTDWYDTRQAQATLNFQQHNWDETRAWVADGLPRPVRFFIRLVSPLLRAVMRLNLSVQKKKENRGRYADPWRLIAETYGEEVLVEDAAARLRSL